MSPLNVLYIPQSREEKELQFSAEMTHWLLILEGDRLGSRRNIISI